jgi:hypothetical protein
MNLSVLSLTVNVMVTDNRILRTKLLWWPTAHRDHPAQRAPTIPNATVKRYSTDYTGIATAREDRPLPGLFLLADSSVWTREERGQQCRVVSLRRDSWYFSATLGNMS